ncbi:hypothetical protein [Leptolyngbya ohadii]|uniref:hypothetical protein n=1 Tax=Leptolyngbya ohadii TaxID=1962290 RepID=UPI000B59E8E3|nr:hypothetical protein [Leptolyngbya ohadii]
METLGYLHLSVCREIAARPTQLETSSMARSQPVERSRYSQNFMNPDQRGSGRSVPPQTALHVLMP